MHRSLTTELFPFGGVKYKARTLSPRGHSVLPHRPGCTKARPRAITGYLGAVHLIRRRVTSNRYTCTWLEFIILFTQNIPYNNIYLYSYLKYSWTFTYSFTLHRHMASFASIIKHTSTSIIAVQGLCSRSKCVFSNIVNDITWLGYMSGSCCLVFMYWPNDFVVQTPQSGSLNSHTQKKNNSYNVKHTFLAVTWST